MPDNIYIDAMADVSKANEDGMDFQGKKYTPVAARVEILRKHFGGSVGISTEIIELGKISGEPVVVRAMVTDLEQGHILGTGHAWEVIGQGFVNKTSALENAETSAIGRALASLGIHGGEFASANELRDKEPNPTKKALKDAEEDAIMDALPEEYTEQQLAEAYAARIEQKALGYKTRTGIDGYMKSQQVQKWMDFISLVDDDMRKGTREKVLAHREGLTK